MKKTSIQNLEKLFLKTFLVISSTRHYLQLTPEKPSPGPMARNILSLKWISPAPLTLSIQANNVLLVPRVEYREVQRNLALAI